MERRLSTLRNQLRPSRALPVFEAAALFCGLLVALTVGRPTMYRLLGSHADVWALLSVFTMFGLVKVLFNDRVASALDRRFALNAYDDRRILFDLGQAARAITSIDQLFKLVVDQVQEALHVADVSIFVLNDETGDFDCRVPLPLLQPSGFVSGKQSEEAVTLEKTALIVKRLRNLSTPLGLDPHELEAWERSLMNSSSGQKASRECEIRTLRRLQSRLFVQVLMRNELIGIISLGPKADGRNFSQEDKQLLAAVAGQMAFIIEHSKLVGRIVEEERLLRELALATEVQQRLFPENAPETNTLDLAGFCQPAREIGGDYYDFLSLEEGQIGLAIADVAGKGIAAALLMSIIQASLRSQASAQRRFGGVETTLSDLVHEMNRLLWRSTSASSYVTFFYAQFNESTRQLTYVNAGHNPPLLIRRRPAARVLEPEFAGLQLAGVGAARAQALPAAGRTLDHTYNEVFKIHPVFDVGPDISRCARLSTGGMALGLFDESRYDQETIQMASGDLLLAYTDGLTEALNIDGEEFGEVRLEQLLTSLTDLTAEQVRFSLIEHIREWCQGAAQHDDLTFVVIKVK